MSDLRDLKLRDFLGALAARQPTPGGGAAAALAGAAGAALAGMCAAYTSGEKFKAAEPRARAALERLEPLRERLAELIERDARAYAAWTEARKLPRGGEAEKRARQAALEAAREEAIAVPETVLAAALEGLEQASELAGWCNPSLLADVPVAARLLEAAASGACTQALGNLRPWAPGSPEAARAAEARKRRARCAELAARIEAAVMKSWGLPDDT
ncbi:MAG: cyclodeaminase/cyclohydrolase family protein [Planctomycetota bacterium]|nr:cyclodeaminase/cyclohydrolase family protein [Planctomycetota bacterium]